MISTFEEELARLINTHSLESDSNTPDHVLAEFMRSCLDAYNAATMARDAWYGISPTPNQPLKTRLDDNNNKVIKNNEILGATGL